MFLPILIIALPVSLAFVLIIGVLALMEATLFPSTTSDSHGQDNNSSALTNSASNASSRKSDEDAASLGSTWPYPPSGISA